MVYEVVQGIREGARSDGIREVDVVAFVVVVFAVGVGGSVGDPGKRCHIQEGLMYRT